MKCAKPVLWYHEISFQTRFLWQLSTSTFLYSKNSNRSVNISILFTQQILQWNPRKEEQVLILECIDLLQWCSFRRFLSLLEHATKYPPFFLRQTIKSNKELFLLEKKTIASSLWNDDWENVTLVLFKVSLSERSTSDVSWEEVEEEVRISDMIVMAFSVI